jgi:hypothetical protein
MRSPNFHLVRALASAASLSLLAVGCSSISVPDSDPDPTGPSDPGLPGEPGTSGGSGNTFEHPDQPDPWEILDRMVQEGPPSYSAHVHSCMKMKYATLGTVLASRGVNLTATGATSAGALYKAGDQAFGVASYGQRQPEATDLSTAGASKMLDVLASAASEIITAMPDRTECKVGGVATQMFDTAGACTAHGIECITGLPASPAEIELCSQIVINASTPAKGQTMAVAVTMAAAQICE